MATCCKPWSRAYYVVMHFVAWDVAEALFRVLAIHSYCVVVIRYRTNSVFKKKSWHTLQRSAALLHSLEFEAEKARHYFRFRQAESSDGES